MMVDTPYVSVIIPMFNEERFISACLDSLLANDYPASHYELLVVDGMSTDKSREIVRQYARIYQQVHLLDNPQRIQAAALNIGLQQAKGDIIVRADAHTTYASDYISQCVGLLQTTGAHNVGGPQRAVGTGYISSAIAIATTTAFGAGDAYFRRYVDRELWVDTVFPGAWRRSTLLELGGFNEELKINEDYELNIRLRKSGGKVLLSPRIKCQYRVRSSLPKFALQYFRYGIFKVKTLHVHPDSLRWRQLVPPALTICVLLSLALLPFVGLLAAIVPAIYFLSIAVASLWAAKRRGWRYLPVLPIIYPVQHLSFGTGFLVGLLTWGVPPLSVSSLVGAISPVGSAYERRGNS